MTKWNAAIHNLSEWMKQQQMDPLLIHTLIAGIQAWCEGTNAEEDTPVFNQQSQLGWDAALDSWLGMEWCVQQDSYWVQW